MGFRYLYDVGYINREMDTWFHVCSASITLFCLLTEIIRNETCTTWYKLKFSLPEFSAVLTVRKTMKTRRLYFLLILLLVYIDTWDSAFDGAVPPHFYGEMAKTDLGCQILQEKGHFTEFAQFIRQHGTESDDTDLIMKLKSILWAVVCLSLFIAVL